MGVYGSERKGQATRPVQVKDLPLVTRMILGDNSTQETTAVPATVLAPLSEYLETSYRPDCDYSPDICVPLAELGR